MGLRFIIGRAGTGKTHLCIEEIIHQSNTGAKRQILIVPEQFTSQAERDLIAATGQNAILTAEVLSFGRLAHRVFSKKGIGNRLPLGDIGKAMALRKILLAEKDNISYFHSVLEQPGFIDQLGLTISEFFQYRISPEDTETLAQAEGLSHAAREKLTDLNRIYRSYLDFSGRNIFPPMKPLGFWRSVWMKALALPIRNSGWTAFMASRRRNTASSAACCSFPRRSTSPCRWIKTAFTVHFCRPPRHFTNHI